MKYFRRIAGVVLILCGLVVFLSPYVSELLYRSRTAAYVKAFDEAYGGKSETTDSEEDTTLKDSTIDATTDADSIAETATDIDGAAGTATDAESVADDVADADSVVGIATDSDAALYDACVVYNEAIYEEEQSGLVDAWSYEQAAIEVDADEFGYIEIPAMDLIMPLYLGASEENMARGATVLGQTSIPIGGENTNAVIAGHRGYRGSPYFREIERLSVGDEVYITNRWETLTYIVTDIDMIYPDDKDAIRIQEGKDMVTLITCHPYHSHGKYRYVVYCERSNETDESVTVENTENTDAVSGSLTASDGNIYALSAADIRLEKLLRWCCGIAILLILLFTVSRRAGKK